MNQRIRQLALHAGMKECALGFGMPENVLWGDDQIKNFAELIVRECAQQCFDLADKLPTGNFPAGLKMGAYYIAGETIKLHFGFEQ